jgi:signal peptidase I
MLKGFLSFAGFVTSVVVLATLINLFVFQSYYVDGTSMTPTLQPNERLIIDKLPKTWAKLTRSHFVPKRGEIVVFNSTLRSPENGEFEQLIKRVIGLPGERVVVKDGTVTIYNQAHPSGFKVDESLNLTLAATDGEIDEVVPQNELFVMGDNRGPGGSYDSRTDLGSIPSNDMVGELVLRLIPLNKAKIF